MAQYTVYGLYPSALGDPVSDADATAAQECINQAIADAGLGNRAHVVVTDDAGRYTFLPSRDVDSELMDAVDAGIEAFYGGASAAQ